MAFAQPSASPHVTGGPPSRYVVCSAVIAAGTGNTTMISEIPAPAPTNPCGVSAGNTHTSPACASNHSSQSAPATPRPTPRSPRPRHAGATASPRPDPPQSAASKLNSTPAPRPPPPAPPAPAAMLPPPAPQSAQSASQSLLGIRRASSTLQAASVSGVRMVSDRPGRAYSPAPPIPAAPDPGCRRSRDTHRLGSATGCPAVPSGLDRAAAGHPATPRAGPCSPGSVAPFAGQASVTRVSPSRCIQSSRPSSALTSAAECTCSRPLRTRSSTSAAR